jgi:hypothetical protein
MGSSSHGRTSTQEDQTMANGYNMVYKQMLPNPMMNTNFLLQFHIDHVASQLK